MKLVKVLDKQRIIDLAMQELGNVERVFEICQLNGLSVTEILEAGSELLVPDFAADKKRMVAQFADKSLAPASGDDKNDPIPNLPGGGIGFMRIISEAVDIAANDFFIVS